MNRHLKLLKALTMILGIFAIVLAVAQRYSRRMFGDVSLEQIVWHIRNARTLTGAGMTDVTVSAVKHVFLMLVLVAAWIVFMTCLKKLTGWLASRLHWDAEKGEKAHVLSLWLVFLAVCGANAVQIRKMNVQLEIVRYMTAEDKGLFAFHYSVPAPGDITFAEKKNLVIVLAESLENSYCDPEMERCFTPELQELKKSAVSFDGVVNTPATSWTIAALTGWFFGLPLKVPAGTPNGDANAYRSERGFLPNARSVMDVLRENGYEFAWVLGSDKLFSSKDLFFARTRGRILDKNFFAGAGWNFAEHEGTEWGFNDRFVFARAFEEYQRLVKSGRPFVLLVETVDTHFPDGWCPSERAEYGDIRDAIMELDRNAADFVRRILALHDPDTVVAVLGDHFYMGTLPFHDIVKKRRSVYTAMWGTALAAPRAKRGARATAMDIAPTLLNAAGARWEGGKFGLGQSLFSEKPTLAEKTTVKHLNDILFEPSGFYDKFF